MSADVVQLVPHTHWDREWYEPFQRFRFRLVHLLDEVLDRAEADPEFCFTLDGQMAAVDDYLEVRPEHRDRVAALVLQGRLAVGPWQILLDEFLCSGETIVRNLRFGWAGAQALGAAMPVGYLPDMFGHCAQMPQVLARAGLRHACVWRGVPADVDGHAFRWTAPDGSWVRAEYLVDGYANGVGLFALPGRLAEAVETYHRQAVAAFDGDPVLAMFGTDHLAPLPGLMDLARGLASTGAPVRLAVGTLAGYISDRDPGRPGLPVVTGELRSHARANILPGVISVRGHLKRAMAAAERMVGRYAEPFAALWSDVGYDRFLDMAWRRLVDASGHDSVTGCGVDETAVGVAARIAEAEQLGRAVRDEVLAGLAADVPRGGYVVLNPTPARRTGLVEVEVAAAPDGEVPAGLALPDGGAVPVQELDRARTGLPDQVVGPAPWRRLLAAVPAPALGRTTVVPAHGPAPDVDAPVRVDGEAALDSGAVRVAVEPAGTLTVRGADGTVLRGVGRLVDGGDRGDSYNYAPPAADRLVEEPESVAVEVVERGPLRAVLAVDRTYAWPARLDAADRDARDPGTEHVAVRTLVELRTGEPFVRLDVSFRNPGADHRVRLHVPLPAPARTSSAEGQFAVTERGLTAEGGGGEAPVPTFPASAFVAAGDAVVLLDQATEYELVDGGREVALTVLRAVGWLSVDVHPLRDGPAGPQLPVPGAQRVGEVVQARLAVLPHAGGWESAGAPEAAEAFRHDLVAWPGSGPRTAPAPPPAAGLEVTGDGVVVSSVRSAPDRGLELRVVAMSHRATAARVAGRFATATRVDLLGRDLEPLGAGLGGVLHLPLGPWEIATVRLAR